MQHMPNLHFCHLLLACESHHHGNGCDASCILYLDCVGTMWCKLFLFPRRRKMYVKGVALLLEVAVCKSWCSLTQALLNNLDKMLCMLH